MKDFRTYALAVSFYRLARTLPAPGHLRSQLDRASSSVVLNLAEGRGKRSHNEQRRFYDISLGSMRECQAILELLDVARDSEAGDLADHLAASLFKLVRGA